MKTRKPKAWNAHTKTGRGWEWAGHKAKERRRELDGYGEFSTSQIEEFNRKFRLWCRDRNINYQAEMGAAQPMERQDERPE